ncbi:MAG TPA: MFS transporter [Anaerolineae bacterium]|nr:MFS transporter [Anaerolineae bacterium]
MSFFLAMLNNFLFFVSMHLLMVPLPLYVERVGGNPSQVGLVMGTFAMAAILARPYVGRLVDRLGGKPSLLLGSLIFTIGPLLYIVSRSVPALLVARFLHGFSISATSTAYIVIIAALAPTGRRGEAIGLSSAAMPVALMTAPAIGASLLESKGFVPLFVLSASVAALGLLTAFFIVEPRSTDRSNSGDEGSEGAFLQVVRRRGVWVPSVAMGVLAVTYGSIITFLPLFAVKRGIVNPGLFFTAYGLTLIAAQVLAGRVSDRVGRNRVIVPTMVLLTLTFPVLASVRSLPLLLGVGVLYGLGFGGARATLNALMVDRVPAPIWGMAMSVAYGSFDLGIGLGSYLLGWVAQIWGYQVMYGSVGVVCLLGVVAFAFLAKG